MEPCRDAVTTLKQALAIAMQVYRATDGKPVELAKQWGPQERALLIFTRSLGCPFCQELAVQLRRDVMPQLATLRVNVLMVSIGELFLVVRAVYRYRYSTVLDLAFSSFPRMKCVAVGVGDCHPPQRSTLNPMHGHMGAGRGPGQLPEDSGSSGAPCAGSWSVFPCC